MQSTTAAGHRKDQKGRGDGATTSSNSVHHGTGVGTSAAVKDSTQPNPYGDPGSTSDDDGPVVNACGFLSFTLKLIFDILSPRGVLKYVKHEKRDNGSIRTTGAEQ